MLETFGTLRWDDDPLHPRLAEFHDTPEMRSAVERGEYHFPAARLPDSTVRFCVVIELAPATAIPPADKFGVMGLLGPDGRIRVVPAEDIPTDPLGHLPPRLLYAFKTVAERWEADICCGWFWGDGTRDVHVIIDSARMSRLDPSRFLEWFDAELRTSAHISEDGARDRVLLAIRR